MQKKTLFFAGVIICLLILAAAGYYLYQKPRSSLTNIKPDYTLSAEELYAAFQQDEEKANRQFLEKVVQVKGSLENIEVTDSTISCFISSGNELGGINCSLAKNRNNQQELPAKGAVVEVKGRCVGFLMDVNLVDAVIAQ